MFCRRDLLSSSPRRAITRWWRSRRRWRGAPLPITAPGRIPDLFHGRPAILTGRFTGSGKTAIRIRGQAGEASRELAIAADLDDPYAAHAAIPGIWARSRIAGLAFQVSGS
ncbi:MAG: hypothetical protein HY717_11790 [Planctomycetes bacterium]|nr:hypothetical protein [Planctomycetota bacterium]